MEFEPEMSGTHKIEFSAVWINAGGVRLNSVESCERSKYYTFTPTVDGLYYIKDISHQTDVKVNAPYADVVSSYGYFVGKANVPYIFMFQGLSTNVKITRANATEMAIDTKYTAEYKGGSSYVEAYLFNVPEDGYYKLDARLTNIDLNVFIENKWYDEGGTKDFCVFKLEKGMFPIIAYYGSPREGSLNSCADIRMKKAESNVEPSVTVNDLFATPGSIGKQNNQVKGKFTVTAPVGTNMHYGFEYYDEQNELKDERFYANMQYTDINYYEEFVYTMKYNKTYKIKPYVEIDGNKIYGEEKTFTTDLCSDITEVTYTPYIAKFREGKEYNMRYYYFTFTQPADASGKTTISVDDSAFELSVYDSEFNSVNGQYVQNYGAIEFDLIPGETYYIQSLSMASANVEVVVSSLSERPEPSEIENLSKIPGGISFDIAKEVAGAGITFVAIYRGNKLVDVKTTGTQIKAYDIFFDKIDDADNCRVIIIDKNTLKRVCEKKAISFR